MPDYNFKPEWNVFVEDFGRKEIIVYNIFEHFIFKEDCDKAWENHKDNLKEFETEVKRSLMFYYWSKCEWEIALSDFPPSEKFTKKKVDVYQQVMMNWEIFIAYLYSFYETSTKRNESI